MEAAEEQLLFRIGDRVEGYWPETDDWLPASLSAFYEDGSLQIVWTEDDSKSDVPFDYVRHVASDGGELAHQPVLEPTAIPESAPSDALNATSDQRSPLKRLRGAQRDTRPAWMTKGLGIGTAILGEATGELLKPGMTRKDLEEIERGDRLTGPDPFGDVFCESSSGRAAVVKASRERQRSGGAEQELVNGTEGDAGDCEEASSEPVFMHDGGMLSFDGTPGSAIDVPYSTSQNPSRSFSVHFWSEPHGGEGYRSPVSSRDFPPQRGYAFFITPNGHWSFWLGLPESKEWLKVEGPLARKDEWQRLLGTYCDRERVLRLFVDGEQVSEKFAPARPRHAFAPNTCRPLRLGAGATEGAAKFHFLGAVNDVRVYNRALSVADALLVGCDGDDGLPPPAKRVC